MFGGLGTSEIILILLIVLIIFGAGKLPEVGAGLGKAIRNFKKASSGEDVLDVTPREQENKDSQELPGKTSSEISTPVEEKEKEKVG